jgi:phosphorylase kinase alpha/beta subunit
LVDYLASIEYWKDPDNGVWEEYEEVHVSSIGACVAGLRSVAALPFVRIPEGLIERGEEALRTLLPRESATKFCDLAQLSLIFPYNLLDRSLESQILENIEYHLVKERGVIRYKTDKYYNRNAVDKWSEEAEWTMGFPWLAIIYARRGDREKAEYYLRRTEAVLHEGKLPELYYSNSDKPNDNIPLGWAESLYVIALLEVAKL